ncbi:solute carrier family 35, member F1/2 [Angomonas deanei]|nr:solute carrier family 35, member F1/2 [Angomonas deanei]|eukprot:EPY34064.1 solute carrier family 35, member F1/2 [Angomonas deanei]
MARYSIFFYSRHRHAKYSNFSFFHRWWKYIILAVVDVEANYCVVLAYQYSDMLSIQLLNCFTVPCVLVLSFFLLKAKFALTHILGCVFAVGGLALLIGVNADGVSRDGKGSKTVLGNILALIASALYATSNVLMEWFIKPREKKNKPSTELPNEDDDEQAENSRASHMSEGERGAAVEEEPVSKEKDVEGTCVTEEPNGEDAQEEPENENEPQLPPVPIYIPIIENLALMSLFAATIATIQFFAAEFKTFNANKSNWTGEDWMFQIVFGINMLLVYTGMPALFFSTSAAFANISLLTANVYSIIWNVTLFKIYPTAVFIAAFIIIVIGIVIYNLTDIIGSRYLPRWMYPCGLPRPVEKIEFSRKKKEDSKDEELNRE